ncbi:unnamed protein product [Sphagnum troendelagicum]|uniref:START domain-containing protein n=1 Tax=Sphagnum troendelagicum TaxID=128251 RepID=A0ABP0UV06_9BRYO
MSGRVDGCPSSKRTMFVIEAGHETCVSWSLASAYGKRGWSRVLDAYTSQVKSWFQKRRTHTEEDETTLVPHENDEKLRAENVVICDGHQDPEHPPRQSKRSYHRHTPRQIQELETMFKECPHLDEKQRQRLIADLGLQPRQQLRIENGRLTEELDRVSALDAKHLGRSIPGPYVPMSTAPLAPLSLPSSSLDPQVAGSRFGSHPTPGDMDIVHNPSVVDVATRPGGLSETEKPLVVDLAVMAMEELMRMAQVGQPLWMPADSGNKEQLNYEEYTLQFPRNIGLRPHGLKTEATRDTGLVMSDAVSLVEALLDSCQWMEMFPCMVLRALTVDVLSTGVNGNRHGALQLMNAELQVLSPLVTTPEIYFLRYCKQHAEGVWAVVDVSVDSIRDNPPPCLMRCRRRPSGMLIQETSNGYCKVTAVEHMEYDDRGVHYNYRDLVNSGIAFGAQRWIATLQRQCERLPASLLATRVPSTDLAWVPTADGRRSILKLGQRMTNNFCAAVSASAAHSWTTVASSGENDDVRVMTRNSIDNLAWESLMEPS